MKKILSLILILSVLVSSLLLASCNKDGEGDTTTPAENIIPSTPEELINLSLDKTYSALFGAPTEKFIPTSGVKTNLYVSAPALSDLKIDADFIMAAPENKPFFGFNVKELTIDKAVLGGIKLYVTDTEIVAGFDSLLSRNLGLRFSEASEQITALVSKLMPGTSVSSIRTEVNRYLEEIESILGSNSSEAPKLTPEMVTEIKKVVNENIEQSLISMTTSTELVITFSLKDVLNMIQDTETVLKDDEEWRAFLKDLDNALRETVFVDTAIPSNTTVLEFLISEIESGLANEGLTPDSFEIKIDSTVNPQTLLVTSSVMTVIVADQNAASISFNANYEGLARFTVLFKAHKNTVLEVEEDVELLEIKYQKTADNATTSGFILDVINKDTESTPTAGGAVNTATVDAFTVKYSKDSSDNAYEFAIETTIPESGQKGVILKLEGVAYENKDEYFFSIDEFGSDALGVALILDLKIKMTNPTESDLSLPAYDDLGSIKEKELSDIIEFFSSLLPEEGVPEEDVSGSVAESAKPVN